MSKPSSTEAFRQKMTSVGLVTNDQITADGQIHRIHIQGDKPGSKNGYYVLHGDGLPAGMFGSWKTGQKETWCSKSFLTLTKFEREAFNKRMEEAREQREQEQSRIHAKARKEATRIWSKATAARPEHPYLKKKGVSAYGLKQTADGRLVMPAFDIDGALHGVQYIAADGDKKFLTGTAKKGHFHLIGKPDGIIYICEGYATGASIHEATRQAVVCSFDAGNLKSVAEAIKQKYPDAALVICADNDQFTDKNPGLTKGREAAKAVNGRLAVPEFHTLDKKATDFNDLGTRQGLETVRRQIEAAEEPRARKHGFKLQSIGRFLNNLRPPEWVIKGLLEKDSLGCIFGPPGSLKSFVAISISLSVATGTYWYGHMVKNPGPVVYIAGEGLRGISRRILGWMIRNQVKKPPPFFVSNMAAQLLDKGSLATVTGEIANIKKEYGNPVLIVIDTLNRNMGSGDENSTQDMTELIAALDVLRQQTGAAILVIHHTGVTNNSRARGSSVLRGAMDFEFKVEINNKATRLIQLSMTKSKDSEPLKPMAFKGIVVELEECSPDKNEPLSTLILEAVDASTTLGSPRLPTGARIALAVLTKLAKHGPVHLDEWRAEAYRRGIAEAPEARKKAFSRARKVLLDKELITCNDNFYTLGGQGDKAGQSGTMSPPAPRV